MRVSHMRYQPIEGGALGGLFALHVSLGSSNDPESVTLSSTELGTMIHDAFATLALATLYPQGVLFDVREADDLDSEEMRSLLDVLRDWKYVLIAWVGEEKRSAWFSLVGYIVAFVHSQHWPNFHVNEIRFEPQGDDWTEPEVYGVNAGATCYVVEQGNRDALLLFVKNAKKPWGVIGPMMPAVGFLIIGFNSREH